MKETPKFPAPFSAAQFEGRPVPPREWLVSGLIPAQDVTLLAGDGGTGKSLIALQLAHAVATGGGWVGRTVEPGAVVYLSCEDDVSELHRRLNDIRRTAETQWTDMQGLGLLDMAGRDAILSAIGREGRIGPSRLCTHVEQAVRDAGASLLVVDTAADVFSGDENSRHEVRTFVGILRGIALRCRCAVLLIAHPSKASMGDGTGYSGSTSWSNSVRSRLYFQHEKPDLDGQQDPRNRLIEVMKSNYGPSGECVRVRWTDGVFIESPDETAIDRAARHQKAERVFLKLLVILKERGETVNPTSGATYAPSVMAKMHEHREGVGKTALKEAMQRLLNQGKIVVKRIGKKSQPRKVIAVAGNDQD